MYINTGGGGGSRIVYLGTGTSFNLSQILPNDYASLTADNFIVGSKSGTSLSTTLSFTKEKIGNYTTRCNGLNITPTYNPSTGMLTLSVTPYTCYLCGTGTTRPTLNWSATVTCFAYVVLGEIET